MTNNLPEVNKYNKSKIYTIRSPHTDKFYIGATIIPLCKRLSGHRTKYNYYLKGESHYVTSFELFKLGGEYIELLENYPCNNVEELNKREGELIRLHKTNVFNRMFILSKEDVKNKIMANHRKHANEKIKCPIDGCDKLIPRANKSVHIKIWHITI